MMDDWRADIRGGGLERVERPAGRAARLQWTRPAGGSALVCFFLGASVFLRAGVVNGDFEAVGGWLVACNGEGGAPPDYSEACAASGSQGFRIGRTDLAPERDGCDGGRLAHASFACGGGGEARFSTSTFQARFLRRDGEEAKFDFVLSSDVYHAFVPASDAFGLFRYSVRTSGARPWFRFSVTGGGAPGVQSTLCLDGLQCEATAEDLTNKGPGVTPLIVSDTVDVLFPPPKPPEDDGSYFLPRDCNSNGRSDAEDIAAGRSRDAGGDGVPDECALPRFQRGDADGNGALNLTDPVRVLNHLFLAKGGLPCLDAADADDNGKNRQREEQTTGRTDNGKNNISDAIYVLNHLFLQGPPLPPPFSSCGADPTEDELGCGSFAPCFEPDGTFFGHTPARPGAVLVLDASSSMRGSGCYDRMVAHVAAFLNALEGRPGGAFGIVIFDEAARRFPDSGGVLRADAEAISRGLDFVKNAPAPASADACMDAGLFEGLRIANATPVVTRVELLFASRLAGTCGGADPAEYVRRTIATLQAANAQRHPVHAAGLFPREESPRQVFIDTLDGLPGDSAANAPLCE